MSPTAVAEYPAYDRVEDLLRDLRAQNFIIEETSEGWRIRSPFNDKTTVAHRNNVHSAKIADLKAMGFFPPSVVKKLQTCETCGQKFLGAMTLTKHKMSDHGYTLTCKVCGEGGFTSVSEHRMHLKTHKGEVKTPETPHDIAAAETEAIREAPTPKTPENVGKTQPAPAKRKRAPVRKGYVEDIQNFIKLADDARDAVTALVDAYKELYSRHQKDKKKLNDLEDAAGRLVSKF